MTRTSIFNIQYSISVYFKAPSGTNLLKNKTSAEQWLFNLSEPNLGMNI